ncbi:response regulator transcription factor [Streptomyces sp. NPDC001811]
MAQAVAGPPPAAPPRLPALTLREREVLAGVGDGLSSAQIGRRPGLGVPTVKAHVSRIIKKLQCENRVQAGLFVLRRNRAPVAPGVQGRRAPRGCPARLVRR